MSRRVASGAPVIFELLNRKQAASRTPFGDEKFDKLFGHLYRVDPDGNNGGFLSTDLQAEVESWHFKADMEQAS